MLIVCFNMQQVDSETSLELQVPHPKCGVILVSPIAMPCYKSWTPTEQLAVLRAHLQNADAAAMEVIYRRAQEARLNWISAIEAASSSVAMVEIEPLVQCALCDEVHGVHDILC